LKKPLHSYLLKNKGHGFWPLWTVGYWTVSWYAVLRHLTGTTEVICFICSWPSYAVLFFPSGTYDAAFFLFVPVVYLLFISYWKRLLLFVTRGGMALTVGCLFHLAGGIALVRLYNESQNGIPFLFYFHETLWGAGLTAGYILGHGIMYMYCGNDRGGETAAHKTQKDKSILQRPPAGPDKPQSRLLHSETQ
jgi:hypothetical protein